MEIAIHRINTIAALGKIPRRYGCEIDIRTDGSRLVLNHEPFAGGDSLVDYLDEYRHGLLILNIKEAGIEDAVLQEVRLRSIQQYFLLDVEFPYIHRATRAGERAIAIRYSEDESIETALNYRNRLDWVWIDTNTRLPVDTDVALMLAPFRTCLVCPERWGRPQDIPTYKQDLNQAGLTIDAVMTAAKYAAIWEEVIVS